MKCEIAQVNSNKDEIRQILQDVKTIALIGCSPDKTKDSHIVAKYLLEHGYTVYPVYPKEDTILGQKVYRNLSDIPYKVDMVDIFRKPAVIANIVDEAIKRGDVEVIWTQLGLVNNKAGEKAKRHGMKVVQNHCPKIEYELLFKQHL
jgi:predicted CoA-binding protein